MGWLLPQSLHLWAYGLTAMALTGYACLKVPLLLQYLPSPAPRYICPRPSTVTPDETNSTNHKHMS